MSGIKWVDAPSDATHCMIGDTDPWRKRAANGGWEMFYSGSWHPMASPTPSMYVPIPAPWNGEGLPPVGTVCEFLNHKDTWVQVRVLSHLVEMQPDSPAVIAQIGQTGPLCISKPSDFRPLRTPEQIAAEERKNALEDMVRLMGDAARRLANAHASESDRAGAYARALIRAGYRKVGE